MEYLKISIDESASPQGYESHVSGIMFVIGRGSFLNYRRDLISEVSYRYVFRKEKKVSCSSANTVLAGILMIYDVKVSKIEE